jgi:hypothetical protein
MPPWMPLGSVTARGAADTTGLNTGNWTVTFAPGSPLVTYVPYFECYKWVAAGAAGSTAVIRIDNRDWGLVTDGGAQEWEAGAAMPLTPGQSVYWFWSDPVTDDTAPDVTMWLRYDLGLAANASAAPGTAATGGG